MASKKFGSWISNDETHKLNLLPYDEWFNLLTSPSNNSDEYLSKCQSELVDNTNFEPKPPSFFSAGLIIKPISSLDSILDFYRQALTSERGYVYPWLKLRGTEYAKLMKAIYDDFKLLHFKSPACVNRMEAYDYRHCKDHQSINDYYISHRESIVKCIMFFKRLYKGLPNVKGYWCQSYIGNLDRIYTRLDVVATDGDKVKIYRIVFIGVAHDAVIDIFQRRGLECMTPTKEWAERIAKGKTSYILSSNGFKPELME